ncbi:hypothetical protein SAMD00079811_03300 [Scytonema sp. HK-05]|uniref:hypothetical protein n=1 Tax=Scytonema sp. HK-05 TaxID=1137095 RepID=UPI000936185E|nr:hypothetical protein [Scytonema sp. HK-05]OKH60054.1 hypothetical protein NIES2130_06270 [Scytonema sp. HK-05]BAY42752.1 hypothetical protein SAMD00079811_03300 [Scytonema sp. HK-05]
MPTPSIATSAPSVSPSQSVTFALSYGDLFLTNFSQKFSSVDSDNQANTSASADGTTATVHNDAVVETGETEALTFATSSAYGENKNYFGFAETHAIIVGNFLVAPGNNLSFNFTSALDLETSIYAPQQIESVSAVRDISFSLYDTSDVPERKLKDFLTNLLSDPNSIKKSRLVFFSVSGKLNSSGKDNFLKSQKSENVTFSSEFKDSNFEGNQKFASTLIRGSAKYSFNNQANVTLIALRTGEARVAAPESSRSLTLLSTPGSQVVPTEGRRPGAPSNRYSNRKVITYTVGK